MTAEIALILKGGADIVIGLRFLEDYTETVPIYKRIGIKVTTALSKYVYYSHITDIRSGFRAYSKKALQLMHSTEHNIGNKHRNPHTGEEARP